MGEQLAIVRSDSDASGQSSITEQIGQAEYMAFRSTLL
jgi:hypothetical protein